MTSASSDQSNREQTGDAVKADKNTLLPRGNLFRPLIADPEELRFYLSFRPYQHAHQYLSDHTEIFAGGLGDMFGIYRHDDARDGYSWQANISGGIYAEFDLKTSSYYLVDNDYFIGIPLTFRSAAYSCRLNLYHRSSHVGDEYVLHSNITRIEYSYEAINFLASRDWGPWRAYYGGEVLIHKTPSNVKPVTVQGGIEYYDTRRLAMGGHPVGGVDLRCTQENEWPVNASVKVGLQFDEPDARGRAVRFLLEGYNGYSPHGQFYNNRMMYFGLGITFEFQ